MITVAQVLGLDGLGLHLVAAGDTTLPVSWVATSELADPTPYLDGGEIVLFTGVNSPPDGPAWADYAGRLADRGVVALGMGVGKHLSWDQVPAELVEAARGAALTLFSVPQPTPFLRIIQAVAGLRAAEDRAALENTLSHQRALTRAATAVGGPARVLRTLASLFPGAWAAVCTADAEILERSGPGPPALPSERSLEELVARVRGAGLRGSLSESGPSGVVVVHPLGVHGAPHGYLVVVLPRPVERTEAGAISTAVALLSLHAERAAEQAESRHRIRAGAVALLLAGDVRAGDALLAVAGDTGWADSVARVRVARLRGSPERIREGTRRIGGQAERAGHRMLVGTPVPGEAGEQLTVVLVEDRAAPLAALRRIIERVDVRAGIGGAVVLEDAATSDHEAAEVLERTGAHRRIGVWDDLVAGGVAGLLPVESARAWARELLRPLQDRGAEGERLLGTLRVFLEHNGNRRRTAAELSVHRNTLLHQLRLIEHALRGSLGDPQLRADLWIALHLPGERGPSA